MGSKDHSFDVVSEVNWQEVDNAVQQTKKELGQRFDFKGSTSSVDFDKTQASIMLRAENEFRLKSLVDLLQTKLAKRNVSLRALKFETAESGLAGGSLRQTISIQNGIPSEKAKEMVKAIKESKLKVQTQIQGEQVRVQSPKIDDLQAAIGLLKKRDFGVDVQFMNYR